MCVRACVHVCVHIYIYIIPSSLCFSFITQDKSPKTSIPLSHLNVTLEVPGLDERGNTMLIAYHNPKIKKTRNVFVYAESGKVCHWSTFDSIVQTSQNVV